MISGTEIDEKQGCGMGDIVASDLAGRNAGNERGNARIGADLL